MQALINAEIGPGFWRDGIGSIRLGVDFESLFASWLEGADFPYQPPTHEPGGRFATQISHPGWKVVLDPNFIHRHGCGIPYHDAVHQGRACRDRGWSRSLRRRVPKSLQLPQCRKFVAHYDKVGLLALPWGLLRLFSGHFGQRRKPDRHRHAGLIADL